MSRPTEIQTQQKTPTVTPLAGGLLQRKCACGQHTGGGECAGCRKKQEAGMLQRAALHPSSFSPHPSEAPPIVHEVLRSPGQPLDPATRAFMEPRFGYDFSRIPAQTKLTVGASNDKYEQEADRVAEQVMRGTTKGFEPHSEYDFSQVRVHTDSKSAESALAVDALAYTVGRDVVFGAGQYAPGTAEGQELLAHELVHVAQQDRSSTTEASRLQRRVQILDDPLPPGVFGPPSRRGADFIEAALEEFTDLDLSFSGNFLQVDAATRAAVRRERAERPTAAEVQAQLFIIPGVSREKASAALKLAQVIIDTRATAVIQPVFGEAQVLVGAFPAAGGGGTQEIDIEDIQAWTTLTSPSIEPLLRIMAFLRGLLGLAAAARPATPLRTDTPGSLIYHEIIESFRAAVTGPGTAFAGPHQAAIDTANVALRAMGNLEFLPCPSPLAPAAGGESRIRTFWRRRRGAGREDRFEQTLFLSAPPRQALTWVDPPVLVQADVATGDPCPP